MFSKKERVLSLLTAADKEMSLLAEMSKALEGKVERVVLSSRLKSHAVCLTSEGDLTLEMQQVLNAMPTDKKVQAKLVMEVNPEHPVFARLQTLAGTEKVAKYAKLLYDQALLLEGMPIEDPAEFSELICELM